MSVELLEEGPEGVGVVAVRGEEAVRLEAELRAGGPLEVGAQHPLALAAVAGTKRETNRLMWDGAKKHPNSLSLVGEKALPFEAKNT